MKKYSNSKITWSLPLVIIFVGINILKKGKEIMDKSLVSIGISVMLIGIGFVIMELFSLTLGDWFYMGSILWLLGGIATILGLTVLAKENWFYSIK